MTNTNQNSSIASTTDIRIVGLNNDKTRKTSGSETEYQVYLQLSKSPTRAWRNIFEVEWKILHPTDSRVCREAVIDRGFLVMHCSLPEIDPHLPVLKKAVAATNEEYKHYAQEQATEQEHIDDVKKIERKAVDDMAKLLHFD